MRRFSSEIDSNGRLQCRVSHREADGPANQASKPEVRMRTGVCLCSGQHRLPVSGVCSEIHLEIRKQETAANVRHIETRIPAFCLAADFIHPASSRLVRARERESLCVHTSCVWHLVCLVSEGDALLSTSSPASFARRGSGVRRQKWRKECANLRTLRRRLCC